MMMKTTLAALLVSSLYALCAGSAGAAGTIRADGDSLLTCYAAANGTAACGVNLVKGQDYILGIGHDGEGGTYQLVNPEGRATIDGWFDIGFEKPAGVEFRAAYTATYWVKLAGYEDGDGFSAWLSTDCRSSDKTKCSLAVGKQIAGAITTPYDLDWYRLTLQQGRLYTLTFSADAYTVVVMRDVQGHQLAQAHASDRGGTPATGTLTYRARTGGIYYAEVSRGHDYTLSMK